MHSLFTSRIPAGATSSRLVRVLLVPICAFLVPTGAWSQGSTWANNEGGRWNDPANWYGEVPDGPTAEAFVSVYAEDYGPGPHIDLPKALTLRRLDLYNQGNVLEFGTPGDSLAIASWQSGEVFLEQRNPGGLDFNPNVTAQQLEVQTAGPVRLNGDIQSDEFIGITARSSLAIGGDVVSPGIFFDFRPAESSRINVGVGGGSTIKTFEHAPENGHYPSGRLEIQAGGRDSIVRIAAPIQTSRLDVDFTPDRASTMTFEQPILVDGGSANFSVAESTLSVAKLQANQLSLSGNTGSVAEIGLATLPNWTDIRSSGVVRITSIDEVNPHAYSNLDLHMPDGTFDVVTDLSSARPNLATIGTLQLSPGGRFDATRTHFGSATEVILAGGNLIADGSSNFGTLSSSSGESILTVSGFGGFKAPRFQAFESDPTATLLVRAHADSSHSTPGLSFATAPTLIGSGQSQTPSVGIVPNLLIAPPPPFDGQPETPQLTTYDAGFQIVRPLEASEYSDTLTASTNVRLTGNQPVSGSPLSVNSLTLAGTSHLVLAAPLEIASGMVVATGDSPVSINRAGGGGRLSSGTRILQFYTASDLNLFVGLGQNSTLVKSGNAKLTFAPSEHFGGKIVVNSGILDLRNVSGISQATVRFGGVLNTHAPAIAANAPIAIERGGRWDLDGYFQIVNNLSGAGTVFGANPNALSQIQVRSPGSLPPGSRHEVGIKFSGNLDLIFTQANGITLTGQSDHTGRTEVWDSTIHLGADRALSSRSLLDLGSSTLDMDGFDATVAGLRGHNARINGGTFVDESILTLDVASGDRVFGWTTLTGSLRLVKTGDGTQEIDVFLPNATDHISVEVANGSLELGGHDLQSLHEVAIRAGGNLTIAGFHDLSVAIDVESGARIERLADIYSLHNHQPHSYRMTAGDRSRFDLLAAFAGSETYSVEFDLARPAITLSDIIQLETPESVEFVLQIGFDAAAEAARLSDLRLGWFDGGEWVNAILGNSTSAEHFVGFRAWDGETALGNWGVDPESGEIWAVLDHAGQFAVIAIPEPATLLYALASLLLLLLLTGKRPRSHH